MVTVISESFWCASTSAAAKKEDEPGGVDKPALVYLCPKMSWNVALELWAGVRWRFWPGPVWTMKTSDHLHGSKPSCTILLISFQIPIYRVNFLLFLLSWFLVIFKVCLSQVPASESQMQSQISHPVATSSLCSWYPPGWFMFQQIRSLCHTKAHINCFFLLKQTSYSSCQKKLLLSFQPSFVL